MVSEPKIAVLVGTRPGIIKMNPLVQNLLSRGMEHLVIHTGQHYSFNMDRLIMKDIGLPEPDFQITRPMDAISHAQQTAHMLVEIEKVLDQEKVDEILVCGDANTNLAGALAGRKLHVKVGHVEAGLRSFDWRMPEEHNRVIIDHISEHLFAPTATSKKNLIEDGVVGDVFLVGNTIVDALNLAVKRLEEKGGGSADREEPYVLMTSHREENVDNPDVLRNFIDALKSFPYPDRYRVVFPIHPRTVKRLQDFNLWEEVQSISHLETIDPLGYLEFVRLMKGASFIMTDSGGIQEESCILGVPCITLRLSTERPETVQVGNAIVAGTETDSILEAIEATHKKLAQGSGKTANPYGDGKAAERIIDTCLRGKPEDEFEAPDGTAEDF